MPATFPFEPPGRPMPFAPIKGFLETSFVDWPGKVASVVFLPGCNYRCPYCHNHELVLSPGNLTTWPMGVVLERLRSLRGWVDGVCVTGGEPTLHDGLPALLATFREEGFLLKLDTNGSMPEVLRGLLADGLVDAVALDLKGPLESIPYRRNAGQGSDPKAVEESLGILATWGGWTEVRTTVHPSLLSLEELCRLAGQAGRVLPGARFTPQPCRTDGTLDSALREKAALAPEAFGEWEGRAREVFEAARHER